METPGTSRLYRFARPWLAAFVLIAVVVAVSVLIEPDVQATSDADKSQRGGESRSSLLEPAPPDRSSIRPYRGFGTWVDIYDDHEWKDPKAAVRRMARKGVQTLFIETANYRIHEKVFKRDKMETFVDKAEAEDIDVVAWYLPDFKNLERDLKRSKAAIKFETDKGNTFDSFALDIESTVVRDIDRRNRRMFRLTRRIKKIDTNISRAAIVPDPIGSLYWPNFLYSEVAQRYDVMLPMGYFTYRTSGWNGVKQHVGSGIAALRERIGREVPLHYIGGLTYDATAAEIESYARVAMKKKIFGGGAYDFHDTNRRMWNSLERLGKLRP